MSNSVLVSQSSIKDFYKADKCPLAWFQQWIKGKQPELKPTQKALIKGLIFERVLIGESRDAQVVNLPMTNIKNLKPTKSAKKADKEDYLRKKGVALPDEKYTSADLDKLLQKLPDDYSKGEKSKEQIEVEELAEKSKPILDELGIVITDVQPELKWRMFVGHLDIFGMVNGKKAIVDVKYTETQMDDRFRGWGEPSEMDHTQALFYRWLYKQAYGEEVDFYYLVFGKTGWVKFLQIEPSEQTEAAFENFVYKHVDDLNEFKVVAKPEYNKCHFCHLKHECEHKAVKPNLESVQI